MSNILIDPSNFMFTGFAESIVDLPIPNKPLAGSMQILANGDTYVCDGDNWVYLSSPVADAVEHTVEVELIAEGNCPSCGAPIHGTTCEYCGQHFRKSRR